MTDAYKTQTQQHPEPVDRSRAPPHRRNGHPRTDIERQGDDRILVQVPGLQDPAELKDILGKTAKMTFQLVDETADPNCADRAAGRRNAAADQHHTGTLQPPDHRPAPRDGVGRPADRRQPGLRPADRPARSSNFRFDTVGAREFGDVTKDNVGHRFAIVLDKQVITAPDHPDPILGGIGPDHRQFTDQNANDLAILLRAGALPAPLNIIEERTVGAELGADFGQGRAAIPPSPAWCWSRCS